MTLLTFSAIKLCKPRRHIHRFFFRHAVCGASRRSRAPPTTESHAPPIGTRLSPHPIFGPYAPAFQLPPRFSSRSAAKGNPPVAHAPTFCFAPRAGSDPISQSDPPRISPEMEYAICFAGRSRGGAGTAGVGMTLLDDGGCEIWWGLQRLEGASAYEAEYAGLVTGLCRARSLGVHRILAQGCSDLVFRQMEGTYKVRKPSLKDYHGKAIAMSREFEFFRLRQVKKSLNQRAIELANMAMVAGSADSGEPFDAGRKDKRRQDAENFTSRYSPGAEDVSNMDSVSISPESTYLLRFDGGSRGNPGSAGAGMVLYDEGGSELWSGCQYLGDLNTNNEAEYMGLITGLRCARSLGVENIVVQGDSQLILNQVEGRYKVKSPSLRDYYDEAMSLIKGFTFFQTSHIERARNARADQLANEAMDTKTSRLFNMSQLVS